MIEGFLKCIYDRLAAHFGPPDYRAYRERCVNLAEECDRISRTADRHYNELSMLREQVYEWKCRYERLQRDIAKAADGSIWAAVQQRQEHRKQVDALEGKDA